MIPSSTPNDPIVEAYLEKEARNMEDIDRDLNQPIAALRAKLAEVKGEAVAWQVVNNHGEFARNGFSYEYSPDLVMCADVDWPANAPHRAIPLYASPQAAGKREDAYAVRCFMDGIDWQHHIGNDYKGVTLYPTIEDTKLGEKCLARGGRCGVVEVEVRLIRWAEEQDLRGEIAARAQGRGDK